jgi:hypothetical protein
MSSTPSMTPQPPAGGPPAPPAASGSGAKIVLWIVGGFVGFGALCIIGMMVVFSLVVHKAKQSGLDPNLMQKNPGLAVAKLAVTANPDVEMISSNDSAGTMVVRDKKTGQVLNLKFDPEKKSMVVTDEHGKTVTFNADSQNSRLQVVGPDGKTATITADAQAGNVEVKGPDGSFKMGANADKAPSWVPAYPGVSAQNVFSASSGGDQSGTSGFVTQDSVDKVLSYYGSSLKSGGMTISTTTTNSDGKLGGLVSGEDSARKHTVMVTAAGDKDGTHVSVTFSAKQ